MRLQPPGALVRLSGSALGNVLAAMIGGGIVGGVEYVVMQLHLPSGVPPLLDAAIIAIITAVLFFVLLRQWRVRRELVLQQLHIVAELNHNVRNALQRLAYSQYLPPQEQTEAVLESVNLIDTTLRELFPAVGERARALPENLRQPEKPPK